MDELTPEIQPLQTVDRALEILLSFDEFRSEWGVTELSEEFGWSRSTAQRLLASLAARGFLRADPSNRRYRLGPAAWRIAALWERSGGLSSMIEPLLIPLAQESRRTALFCIPDGTHVRCITAISGIEGPQRTHPFLNELYPAHAGATSRAHFAFLDPAFRRNLLDGRPLASLSPLTQVDLQAIEVAFDETVAQGYAYSEGEYDAGSQALAVPVFALNRPAGSVTLVENKHGNHDDELFAHLDSLQGLAGKITELLSNRPVPGPKRHWRRGQHATQKR